MFTLVASTHPALRTASRPVALLEVTVLRKQLYWLQKLMKAEGGIALAANQVGDTRRYFVWDIGMCINPEITWTSLHEDTMIESCLSFPGVQRTVSRPSSIRVRFVDERGMLIERGYDGRAARIFQHELDHINGKCIDS